MITYCDLSSTFSFKQYFKRLNLSCIYTQICTNYKFASHNYKHDNFSITNGFSTIVYKWRHKKYDHPYLIPYEPHEMRIDLENSYNKYKKKDTRSMFFGKLKRIHILITIRKSYNFNHMSHSSIHRKAHNTSKDGAYTADV